MSVEFMLLGSVEARVDGRVVGLGHARQRCVLAVLLMEANRVVSVDQLADRIWADRPPQRARNTLYGYLSRLRQALATAEKTGIARRSGGYVLNVEAAAVDLHRFHDLASQARKAGLSGRDEQAETLFGQALGLWRGDAFAGLDTPWINDVRDTANRQRAAAELDQADVRLRLGHHAELLADLATRARAHPLDERLAGQFILALYRCGRPAEALGHYQQIRSLLAEELGCDPGVPLRRLHQHILNADPALDAPALTREPESIRIPAPLPTTAPMRRRGEDRFIGRTAELTVLDQAIQDTLAGMPGVVEIVGEPGIGKTCLLNELSERARKRGLVTLNGRSAEFDQAPYGVFVDALDDHLGNVDTLRARQDGSSPPGVFDALSTVFPALADRFPTGSEPVAVGRFWFHQAVRTLLETLSAGSGLVLGLDDLHWADDATVELIDHLVRHPPRTPLLLTLSYRPQQAPSRLAATMARANAQGRAVRVEVGPLSPAEGAQLCGTKRDHWGFQQLYEASGGNPFYLEALSRRNRPEGPKTVPADPAPAVDDPPGSLSAVLLAELVGLSASAAACARAAAVLGDAFEAEMVAVVARISEAQALTSLDEIAQRDLVRQIGTTRQFRFRHPLVRSAVYKWAGAGWRIEAHARAADALARSGAPLTAQALHVQRSARTGDEQAVDILVQAARQMTTIAPATAAHWTGEALRLLGERSRLRPELWLQQADALGLAGRLRESRDILHTLASQLPSQARDQRARVTAARATMEWMLGRYEDAKTLLFRELADHDGRPRRETAALEEGVAVVALRTNDFRTAVEWSERALRTAHRVGDPQAINEIRAVLALACTGAGDHARSANLLDEVLNVLNDATDDQLAETMDTVVVAGWTAMLHERYDTALRHLSRGLELSRHTGRSRSLADLFAASAYALMWLGRLGESSAYADEALEAAALVGSSEPRSLAEVVSAAVSMWQGDFAGALKICKDSLSQAGTVPGARRSAMVAMLGNTLLLNGDPAGCLSKVLEAGGGPELLRFEAPVRPLWFRLLTSAELALGNVAAAETWADCAAAAVAPDGPPGRRGFALLARAEVQLARQDPAAGTTACRAATEFSAARTPLHEALARLTAGLALSSHAQPGGLAQLEQARSLASDCGAIALADLADDEHRRIASGIPLDGTV